jgi:hypothetical protein
MYSADINVGWPRTPSLVIPLLPTYLLISPYLYLLNDRLLHIWPLTVDHLSYFYSLIPSQESYFTYPPEAESPVDHDILFRAGVAPDGSDTFTPRALIYDLKGAFGSMRKINALYEPEDDRSILDQPGVWPSKPIVQRTQAIPQSTYQEHLDAGLDPPALSTSSVRYWSDYSRVFYHPKSIAQLSEFDVNDKLMPFEQWDVGMELFEKLEREVDLVDRDLRPFIEECDGIQGLQIFTGVDDAWGGWASGWIERLRDEYGKMSIWTWGLGDQGANPAVGRVSLGVHLMSTLI